MQTLKGYKHKVKWHASLSNGGSFFEGKGDFSERKGEKSPWQRLITYTVENKVEITSLSLYTDDGRTFNLPSAGKNPNFKEFVDIEKPIDYNAFRKLGQNHNVVREGGEARITGSEIADLFTCIEAIYPDYRLQLWVDEFNTENCWVLVIK